MWQLSALARKIMRCQTYIASTNWFLQKRHKSEEVASNRHPIALLFCITHLYPPLDSAPVTRRLKSWTACFLTCLSRCMELAARTHPCWTWHLCFRKLLNTHLFNLAFNIHWHSGFHYVTLGMHQCLACNRRTTNALDDNLQAHHNDHPPNQDHTASGRQA